MLDANSITIPSLANALNIPDLQAKLDERGAKIKLGVNGFEIYLIADPEQKWKIGRASCRERG